MSKYVEAFEKVKEACASFDTVDELITLKELVDKATPKKPIHQNCWTYDEIPYTALCPNCKENLGYECSIYYKYCPVCGQALDWSEEDER